MATQSTLTIREVEVLYLIASGYSSKLMADKLGISADTAETHRENVLKKLRAPNSPAAVSIGIQKNILNPNKINVLYTNPSA